MDFYFNKYPDIRNTWFSEFFLHSNLAYSGIYSYANAKYCSLLHKYYLFILQINSTNTVHAGLNLFAGAKAGNSHCTWIIEPEYYSRTGFVLIFSILPFLLGKYLNSITITFAPPRVTPFHSFQNQSYISTVSSTKSNLLFISDEWIDF